MKTSLLGFILTFFAFASNAQYEQLDPTFGNLGIAITDAGSPFRYGVSNGTSVRGSDGSFYIINEIAGQTLIVKKKPSGSTDSTYGVNGALLTRNYQAYLLAIQPDDKLVVCGVNIDISGNISRVLTRLNTDGTTDSGFGLNGNVTDGADMGVLSIIVEPNGNILIAGFINADNEPYSRLSRFSSTGVLLGTFNTSHPANLRQFAKLGRQSDGKIVVLNDYGNISLFRLTATLEYDSSFAISFPTNTRIGALAVQADDKILVASGQDGVNPAVHRFLPNGAIDAGFNSTGAADIDFGGTTQLNDMYALADGKIIVAGTSATGGTTDFALARLNSDGTPDNSFSGDGRVTVPVAGSDQFGSLLLTLSNGFLVTGINGSLAQTAVVGTQVQSNGTADNTFGTNGILTEFPNYGRTRFLASDVQPDGRLVAAGLTWNGTDNDMIIARFADDGKPDSSFSGDGILIGSFGSTGDSIKVVKVQGDGKIIVAGSTGNNLFIARYNPDGSPDNSFAGDGNIVIDNGGYEYITSLLIQPDGKILAAGSALYRFNADGTPDASFGGGDGVWSDNIGSEKFNAAAIALYPDGKIVVAGRLVPYMLISVHNPDGTLFTDFNGLNETSYFGGEGYTSVWVNDATVLSSKAVAVQPDGKILVAGTANARGQVFFSVSARINPDGRNDASYSTGYSTIPASMLVSDMILQTDGKIVFAGTSTDEGLNKFLIVRSNPNGLPDLSFSDDGQVFVAPGVSNSELFDINMFQDRLYAVGYTKAPGFVGAVAKLFMPQGGPLPVTLTDFRAISKGSTVQLQWKTASEINFEGFQVQRGTNSSLFTSIGFVQSKGNGSAAVDYTLTDQQPAAGTNYYRLQMKDRDGKISYSKIVTAVIRQAITLQLSPNPAKDKLFLQFNGQSGKAMISVLDAQGKTVRSLNTIINNAPYPIDISVLKPGLYFVKMQAGTTTITKRFIKQ